jgi:hypothetical protein
MTRTTYWLALTLSALLAALAVHGGALAATKCLDDAGDAMQIGDARAAIDAACKCFNVSSHGQYQGCAAGIVNDRVGMLLLRKECATTVKKIYAQSACGKEIEAVAKNGPSAPCVSKASTGKIGCAVKPESSCLSKGTQQRTFCAASIDCLDAADTNGDLIIGSGDSGTCAPINDAFVDNGDGTIIDNRTGLMWEKLSDDGSVHDWNDLYTANTDANKILALNASGGFAGHTDWRLPTIHELMTLLRSSLPSEFDNNCAPGCTVLTCSCTEHYYYWSSTQFPAANLVWEAFFPSGSLTQINADIKESNKYVRAVRGGS